MQTGNKHEDMKTEIMKTVFKQFRGSENSENTITGLSEKAEGILTKAVEMWPIIQRPFMKDQIEDTNDFINMHLNTIRNRLINMALFMEMGE